MNVKKRISIGRMIPEVLILLVICKKKSSDFEFGCKCMEFLGKQGNNVGNFDIKSRFEELYSFDCNNRRKVNE